MLIEVQEMSTAMTNSVVAAASKLANNTMYSYNAAAAELRFLRDDNGGGGGGGDGGGFEVGAEAFVGIGMDSGSDEQQTFANDDAYNSTRIPFFNDIDYTGNYSDYQQCQNMDMNTNQTYMNISCDSPLDYAIPIYGYCMPFLMIITVISNSLIVLVLSKKSMATPTNFVLMGMAIFDMLTVIFPAPGFWYMYTFGNHYKPLFPVSLCVTYVIFNEIMPAICHTISIWLTLALALQRYIYVCHAPMARTWCTMPRVKRCTVYIMICAVLHQGGRFFDRSFQSLTIEWNGVETGVCRSDTANWVHQYIGEDIYYTCYYLFRVVFVHLLPCVILVWLNIRLFMAMRQAQERRKLLFRENRKKECKKLRDSNCTTLMLIVVLTVFLCAEIPIAIVTALHIVSSLTFDFLNYSIANIFIISTNFFLVLSYPINFGIYCGMSRQFRETFKEIFLGGLIAKKDNSSSKYSIVNGPRTCTNTNETVL